jgi:hypothetical protein
MGGDVPANLAPIFVAAGQAEKIPPEVLAGVASVETNLGGNRATSSTGAQGLMQFEPGTAKGLGINPLDDRAAIFGAAKLLNQYGYQTNPTRAIGAYNGGPGNPQYGYASQVLSESRRLAPQLRSGAAPSSSYLARPSAASTKTITTGGGTDWGSAIRDALLSSSVSGGNPLNSALNAVELGGYRIPTTTQTVTTTRDTGSLVAAGGKSGHYVNPITGATIGRTDMGVDASGMKQGDPIRAMGNSKVLGIMPNWYRGQPYVLMQFLDGPAAGHYWYVSEAINPTVHADQIVKVGQTIGTYNTGGTGLELGYSSPHLGVTEAQATTGYHEGQATPSGLSFRTLLGSVGAR